MEKTINLGGKDYSYKVNFKLSYDFLKFRNKIQEQYDNMSFDAETIDKINALRKKAADKKINFNNINDEQALEFLKEFTDEEKELLYKLGNERITTTLTEEDILEITSKLTGINEEEELYKILDYEVEKFGFDSLTTKLINAISQVFTIAKAN